MVKNTFGGQVKKARIAQKLNQTQLAELAGVTQGIVSKLENGEPLPNAAIKVSQILGIKYKNGKCPTCGGPVLT